MAAIPDLQAELLAVASKNIGRPTVPGVGEATVTVGKAQTRPPRGKMTNSRICPRPTRRDSIWNPRKSLGKWTFHPARCLFCHWRSGKRETLYVAGPACSDPTLIGRRRMTGTPLGFDLYIASNGSRFHMIQVAPGGQMLAGEAVRRLTRRWSFPGDGKRHRATLWASRRLDRVE
jgi:hypothetical protein